MRLSNIPAQPTQFVGRREELNEIIGLLNDPACRLLTLVGPGGIGKTRLAIEAAARFDNMTDGKFFVALQPISSVENVPTAIAAALNLQLHGDVEPKQQLLRFLRDKRCLLLLDNFEHLLDSAMLVVEILEAAPAVKLLITSREILNLREEWTRNLNGLDFPHNEPTSALENYGAVRLFSECVRRVRGDFSLIDEAPCVLDICRMVDGMPLALELAAARLQIFPCGHVSAEISRSVEFLATPRRNVPERHRSMRAVFEWSWGLLTSDEQSVFAALSVFQGGFTLEAAAHIVGASPDILLSLTEKSLLRVDIKGRYDLHELIRQYAAEKLEAAAEISEQVLDRHCDYYADFLHQHEATIHLHSRLKFLREFDNIRAAWRYAVERRNLNALRQAAMGVFWVCYLESWFDEGAALFGAAANLLSVASVAIDDDEMRFLRGMMLMYSGFFQREQLTDSGQAEVNIEAGRAAWRGLAPRPEMGVPLFHAALVYWNIYLEPARILEIAQECLDLFQRFDEPWGLAHTMTLLGAVWGSQGLITQAQDSIEAALVICQRENFYVGTGWCYQVLGELAYVQGQFARSRKYLKEAIKAHEAAHLQLYLSEHYCLSGMSALANGDPDAFKLFNEGIVRARELNQTQYVGFGLAGLGAAHALAGDIRQAQICYDESLSIFQPQANDPQIVNITSLTITAMLLGRFEEAHNFLDTTLQGRFRRSHLTEIIVRSLRGHVLLGLGREAEAQADFFTILSEATATNAHNVTLQTLVGIASLSTVPASSAVELLSMALHHPAAASISKWQAERRLAQLMAILPQHEYTAAFERGQELTLEDAVNLAAQQRSDIGEIPFSANSLLTEPLTERELEILRLVASGLSNSEIADRLFVGVGTVKKHITHIYGKLDVTSRTQALLRAQENGLL